MNNLVLRWETVDDHLECRWCGSGEASGDAASSESRLRAEQQVRPEMHEQYVMERLQPLPMVATGLLLGFVATP
jgi:hypothetical protein